MQQRSVRPYECPGTGSAFQKQNPEQYSYGSSTDYCATADGPTSAPLPLAVPGNYYAPDQEESQAAAGLTSLYEEEEDPDNALGDFFEPSSPSRQVDHIENFFQTTNEDDAPEASSSISNPFGEHMQTVDE
ncbi:unnamed protein product, partial [Amoebophrya sp. A25]|eukprot:GSA25T00013318001.1